MCKQEKHVFFVIIIGLIGLGLMVSTCGATDHFCYTGIKDNSKYIRDTEPQNQSEYSKNTKNSICINSIFFIIFKLFDNQRQFDEKSPINKNREENKDSFHEQPFRLDSDDNGWNHVDL